MSFGSGEYMIDYVWNACSFDEASVREALMLIPLSPPQEMPTAPDVSAGRTVRAVGPDAPSNDCVL
jgi:hypothetical protein